MATQHHVYLSDHDRSKLEAIIRSGAALARYQTKARILLHTDRNCTDRLTDKQIIKALGTSNSNIQRTRISYLENGLQGCLKDRPRSGRKPTITGDIQARIAVIACSDPPLFPVWCLPNRSGQVEDTGRNGWTLDLLVLEVVRQGIISTISRVAVYECLKKTNSSRGK